MIAAIIILAASLAIVTALLVNEVRYSTLQTQALEKAGDLIDAGMHADALAAIDNVLESRA